MKKGRPTPKGVSTHNLRTAALERQVSRKEEEERRSGGLLYVPVDPGKPQRALSKLKTLQYHGSIQIQKPRVMFNLDSQAGTGVY